MEPGSGHLQWEMEDTAERADAPCAAPADVRHPGPAYGIATALSRRSWRGTR